MVRSFQSRPSGSRVIAADGEGRENRPQSRYGNELQALIPTGREHPEGAKHSRFPCGQDERARSREGLIRPLYKLGVRIPSSGFFKNQTLIIA